MLNEMSKITINVANGYDLDDIKLGSLYPSDHVTGLDQMILDYLAIVCEAEWTDIVQDYANDCADTYLKNLNL